MKENTTRHLHLNMALIGGFMGGYAPVSYTHLTLPTILLV